MRKLSMTLIAPLLAAAGLVVVPAVPPPLAPPVPGPGAVVSAVNGFLKAVDQQDRERVARSFAPLHRGEDITCGFDPATGALRDLPTVGDLVFHDVDAQGNPITATDRKSATEALLTAVGGVDRELATTIRSVRAGCPGPECSWGVVEFDRTFRRGAHHVTVPMRATVLVRYQDEEPRMRIFAWHAAPAGPEQQTKK